jgi:hypothetical protein
VTSLTFGFPDVVVKHEPVTIGVLHIPGALKSHRVGYERGSHHRIVHVEEHTRDKIEVPSIDSKFFFLALLFRIVEKPSEKAIELPVTRKRVLRNFALPT